jgi:hypothetical protein
VDGVDSLDWIEARVALDWRLWAMRCASEQYLGRRPVGGISMGDWQNRHGVVIDCEQSSWSFRTDREFTNRSFPFFAAIWAVAEEGVFVVWVLGFLVGENHGLEELGVAIV